LVSFKLIPQFIYSSLTLKLFSTNGLFFSTKLWVNLILAINWLIIRGFIGLLEKTHLLELDYCCIIIENIVQTTKNHGNQVNLINHGSKFC